MKEKDMEKILKAVANRRRLAILAFIKNAREATVTAISHEIELSIKATSKHLRILSSADILERRQHKSYMSYSFSSQQHDFIKTLLKLL